MLTRLFKKSGVHSAVRHDVIEGHGTPDGAILEAEATKVGGRLGVGKVRWL